MISIPLNDNGPVDPPASSLTGDKTVNPAYADAYDDDLEDRPDSVTDGVTDRAPAKRSRRQPTVKTAKKSAPKTAEKSARKNAESRPTHDADKSHARSAVIGRTDVAAMLASPVEGTKALGLKLEKARRTLAQSPEAERLRAIPDATPEHPDPWVSEAGRAASLGPIPPKGEAPAIGKKTTKGKSPKTEEAAKETQKGTLKETPAPSASPASDAGRPETPSAPKAQKVSAAKRTKAPKKGVSAAKAGLIGELVKAAEDGLDTAPAPVTEPLSSVSSVSPDSAPSTAEPEADTPVRDADEGSASAADDPRYRDDGVPTGLVEDIAPKRLSAKEIKNLPGRLPSAGQPALLPDDEDDDSPAVAALLQGDWLSEALPVRTVYRHDALLDNEETPVATVNDTLPDGFAEEEEDFRRHRTPSQPPQPDWSDHRGGRIPEANYAMRMDAWEKAVIAADARKGCDIPEQHRPRDIRENLGTGTDTTVAGFPAPVPLREWTTEDGRPVRVDTAETGDGTGPAEPLTFTDALLIRWTRTDRTLRLALTTLAVVGTAALSGWLSARTALPALVAETTPVAIAAIVREEDVRELMVLANLLDQKEHSHRRAPIAIAPRYLPDSLLDTEGRPLPGLLTDLHFRAALKEAADRLGAPVMSASTVLAIPTAGEEKHPLATQTLDITEDVKALLGLSGLESAALRDLLKEWVKAEDRRQTASPQKAR